MRENVTVELSDEHFIAAGIYCQCFESPSNRDECIKIPLEGKKAQKRLKADINYYDKLHQKNVDMGYIADYLGEVQTSLGLGYRYECVRDFDGNVSKRLDYYLESLGIDQETLYKQMEKLAAYLLENKILISDIHSRNILMQVNEVGAMKPVIVDGIGDRVAIELLNLFPGVVESKIIRRWNRFATKELSGNGVLDSA